MFSRADLHIHTWYSYDSLASVKKVVQAALNRGLKIIAITDHDAINGAFKTKEYVEKNGIQLEVIIGEEISSKGGHVIGLFLKEMIPPHLSLRETIRAIKAQGGMVVIPHPTFSNMKRGERIFRYRVHYKDLLENPDILEQVDAIEAANFTMFDCTLTNDVHQYAKEFNKALIGSSDAHMAKHIGAAFTVFPGETVEDLIRSIHQKTTQPVQARAHTLYDWLWQHSATFKIPFSVSYYTIKNTVKAPRSIYKKSIDSKKHKDNA